MRSSNLKKKSVLFLSEHFAIFKNKMFTSKVSQNENRFQFSCVTAMWRVSREHATWIVWPLLTTQHKNKLPVWSKPHPAQTVRPVFTSPFKQTTKQQSIHSSLKTSPRPVPQPLTTERQTKHQQFNYGRQLVLSAGGSNAGPRASPRLL